MYSQNILLREIVSVLGTPYGEKLYMFWETEQVVQRGRSLGLDKALTVFTMLKLTIPKSLFTILI